MNIAILIPELCGGGAERVAQIIGNQYVQRGDEVFYFIGNTDLKRDYQVKGKIIQTGLKSCMYGSQNDAERIFKLLNASLKVRRLKQKYKIDVAISFMEECNYLNVLSKGKEKVITRVCTLLSKRTDQTGFLYYKSNVRFFYSKADKVIVMSQDALKEMHEYYGVPLKKILKIHNAVLDRIECKEEETWQYGSKAVVCVGRLEPVKQQERIIRAFSYVSQLENQAKLVILGKGMQLNYLKKLCNKYQISDKVFFVGFTENVTYYLRYARVFVMASKVEGFPNSMIEAMNYGVPIITTNSPGACREIVGGNQMNMIKGMYMLCKYGVLTPAMPNARLEPNSQLSEQELILGKAILNILEDNAIYERYHVQSLERAKMFHINKIIQMWDCIIN